MDKLNERQKRFCEEYIIDLNAKQSYIRAGYSENGADVSACQLLSNPKVQDYIKKLKHKVSERLQITQDRVLNEYARIAFADPRKFFDNTGNIVQVDELDDDDAAVVSSVETERMEINKGEETIGSTTTKKIKFWDKLKALDALSRHLGLFEKDNNQRKDDEHSSLEKFALLLDAARGK